MDVLVGGLIASLMLGLSFGASACLISCIPTLGVAAITQQGSSSSVGLAWRFNSGRWLVVCNGEKRMHNLKAQTEKAVGVNASLFLFSTMEQIEAETVLNMPIWMRGGSNKVMSLVNTIEVKRC